MSTVKDFRFRVGASPLPRRRVRITSEDKAPLEAAVPPEFRGGTPGLWSPEELLIASVASCYALTLASVGRSRSLDLRRAEIEAVGHVTRRAEGRLGFVAIELLVELTVDSGLEHRAAQAARDAHRACIVGHALAVPVELDLHVRTANEPERLVCADAVTAMLTAP